MKRASIFLAHLQGTLECLYNFGCYELSFLYCSEMAKGDVHLFLSAEHFSSVLQPPQLLTHSDLKKARGRI